jgi:hypothetical protein
VRFSGFFVRAFFLIVRAMTLVLLAGVWTSTVRAQASASPTSPYNVKAASGAGSPTASHPASATMRSLYMHLAVTSK